MTDGVVAVLRATTKGVRAVPFGKVKRRPVPSSLEVTDIAGSKNSIEEE
jgi:hypothetical protein